MSDNWISIKDELPPFDVPVFLLLNYNHIILGQRIYDPDAEGWLWAACYDAPTWLRGEWDCESEYDDEYKPTHWHALPDLPEFQLDKNDINRHNYESPLSGA